MSKSGPVSGNSDIPWSFPVAVAQLPETGLHQVLEADATQRQRIAEAAGVNTVLKATAAFDVMPGVAGQVSVTGTVRATVGQDCVVTLEPVENTIDEQVSVVFAPPSQIPANAKFVQKDEGEDAEIPDPPDPIINGVIDLGQVAAEHLILGIDPYPRKPGVVFTPPVTAEDPDEHPFAALKALKATPDTPQKPKDRKPKGK